MALQPGLTCQQIVVLACQETKGSNYLTQAGQYLNLVLQELSQDYKLVGNQFWLTGQFTISPLTTDVHSASVVPGSGPYALPANFLRCDFGDFFWTLAGISYFPTPLDNDQFDALIQQPGFTSYPSAFTVDMSTTPPGFYIWPASSGAYNYYMRYRGQQADITTPESSAVVPWFPNQTYLKEMVCWHLASLTGDDRRADYHANAARILNRYLQTESNDSNRAVTVKKDPRHFGPRWQSLPRTKQVPW